MRSYLLSLLVVFGTALSAQTEGPLVWHRDLASAQAEAHSTGRLLFVDLYAEWCGWCKVLEKEVFASSEFRKLAKERFVLLRVDVEDGAEGTELQLRYGATSLPTALLLDARLVSVGKVVGYSESADYIGVIQSELVRNRLFESAFPSRLANEDLADLLDLADELVERQDGARAAVVFDRVLSLGTLPEDEIPWTLYQRADALRMAESWKQARTVLEEGVQAAFEMEDGPTSERLGLLRYQIARDQGDCRGERAALELFLSEYPDSELRSLAEKTLQQIDSEDDPQCS
jgi:thioredoxin-related protein